MLLLTGPPQNFLNTKFYVNCSENSLSARGYKGILYLENLGVDQLKKITLYVPSVKKNTQQNAKLGIGRGHYYFGWPWAGTGLSRSPLVSELSRVQSVPGQRPGLATYQLDFPQTTGQVEQPDVITGRVMPNRSLLVESPKHDHRVSVHRGAVAGHGGRPVTRF